MKAKVQGNILQTDDTAIEVGSQKWFSWLETPAHKGFNFEDESGNISVRKEKRVSSSNEYWSGYKKKQGRLRRVYIGTSPQLTLDKLGAVCKEINQSEEVFWTTRKSYTTKDCVTDRTEDTSYTTTSCVTNGSDDNSYTTIACVTEVNELQQERDRNKVLTGEVHRLQSYLITMQPYLIKMQQKLSEKDSEIAELRNTKKTLKENLDNLLQKSLEREKEYTSLDDLNETLVKKAEELETKVRELEKPNEQLAKLRDKYPSSKNRRK